MALTPEYTAIFKKKLTDKNEIPRVSISMRFHCLDPNDLKYVEPPWWLRREWVRIEHEIYPCPTVVLTNLNNIAPQYAVHISEEDPTQIAYTPDKAYGEADRQVRTNLARFITKYYPHLSDNTIRDLQAAHLAELNSTFEILTGSAIAKVYMSGQGGAACMSKSPEDYTGRVNPTLVYDMPNISMAVLRDSDGKITNRCMLYTPSGTDKRWIRCYGGDPRLAASLKRAGYVSGTWHGAEFKVIPAKPKHPECNQWLLPYLDGNGSAGSTDRSMVAMVNGKLISITEEHSIKLKQIAPSSVYCALSTSGVAAITNVNSSEFTVKCYRSGVEINLLECEVEEYWDGSQIQTICEDATDGLLEVYYDVGHKAWADPGIARFEHRGRCYVETDDLRQQLGYIRLDKAHYPEETAWFLNDRYNQTVVQTSTGYIKVSEAVYVIQGGRDCFQAEHESTIGLGYTKVHALHKDQLYYAAPGVEVVKTVTGRKVVPGVHNVVQLYGGEWDFERNVKKRILLGKEYYFPNSVDVGAIAQIGSPFYREKLAERFNRKGSWNYTACTLIQDYVSRYIRVGGSPLYRLDYTPKWAQLMADEGVKAAPLGLEIDRVMQLLYAEANAEDYNLTEMERQRFANLAKEQEHKNLNLKRLEDISEMASQLQAGKPYDEVVTTGSATTAGSGYLTSAWNTTTSYDTFA